MSEEYPIKGGKDTVKIRAQRINQPAGMFLHFSAAGRMAWKIFSLYTRNKMDSTNMVMPAKENKTFLTGDRVPYQSVYFRLSLL
jgi:hypothetical protein